MPRKSITDNLTKSLTRGKYADYQSWPDFAIGAVNSDPGRVFFMTYQEQIKNPQWQKKRLEIFERDHYTCMSCGETEKTLHVHHLAYYKNKSLWQYKLDDLTTLCEECHSDITNSMQSIKNIFQSSIATTDHAMEYLELAKLVEQLSPPEINTIRKIIQGAL